MSTSEQYQDWIRWQCLDDNFEADLKFSKTCGDNSSLSIAACLWRCTQCKWLCIGEKIYCPDRCGCSPDAPKLNLFGRFKRNRQIQKQFDKSKKV
jgi:hypothetical protein